MNIIIIYSGDYIKRNEIINRLKSCWIWSDYNTEDENKIVVRDLNVTAINKNTSIKFMPINKKARGYRADLLLIPKSMKGKEDICRYVLPMARGLVYYYEDNED